MDTNQGIIRAFGESEKMLTLANVNTTSVYLVKSKVDLNQKWSIFEQAVLEWQRRDPFLKSRILKRDGGELFFQRAPDDVINSTLANNLVFLKLSRKFTRETENEVWKALVEREPKIQIACYDDLLWRILILELEADSPASGPFNYVLIFTVHHAIAEGRGMIKALLELNQLFEAIYVGDLNEGQEQLEMTPTFENLIQEKFGQQTHLMGDLTEYKIDDFVNSLREKPTAPEKSSSGRFDDTKDFILDRDGQLYLTLNELFEITAGADSKLKCLVIETDRYRKLLGKCKKNNVKFNGCLNLIFSLAIKFVQEKFANNHDSNFYKEITNLGLISNRDVVGKDSKFSVLGFFLSFYGYSLKDQVKFESRQEFYKKFWTTCKTETEFMRQQMDSHHFKFIDLNLWKEDAFYSHLISSNIGVVPSSLTKDKLIEFTERYIHFHVPEQCLFMYGACSINERLSLSILYSTKPCNWQLADYLIQMIQTIVDDIINLDF